VGPAQAEFNIFGGVENQPNVGGDEFAGAAGERFESPVEAMAAENVLLAMTNRTREVF
jgi:hypothetical protein